MSRILAVWEMGANMGHIDRMLVSARALRDCGHEVHFLLRDLSRAHQRVVAEGFTMGQSPMWLPRLSHPPRLGNFAAVLAAAGWLDPPGLAGLLCGWRDAFRLARPDAVLCDHAPTALLALRGTDIVTWAVGNSFEVPPPGPHFPPMNLDDPGAREHCPGWDATVLGPANQALALIGEPPMARLADLFGPVHRALVTLPELAHYDGYPEDTEMLGPSYVGDVGVPVHWPVGEGPRVFAYLEPTHPGFNAVMAAMRALDVVAVVHAKGLSEQAMARLGGPRLRFEPAPVQMDPAVAGADVVVSHASLGTSTSAALAGKPQLVLPSHAEQGMVARRLLQTGAALQVPHGRTGVDVQSLLARLLHEPAFADAAVALAQRHAGASSARTGQHLAALVGASLQSSPVQAADGAARH